MGTSENLFLGFDTGGLKHFGWSICRGGNGGQGHYPLERLTTGLADDAWDAITQVKSAINAHYPQGNFHVMAAGIDAPLLWNKRGDNKGNREADAILTGALKKTQGPWPSVVAVNSLYGAVTVQGPLLVRHLSANWDLTITESHPSVFRHLLPHDGQFGMRDMVGHLTDGLPIRNQQDQRGHELDATLCAVAAWAAIQKPPMPQREWRNLYKGDPDLYNPSGIPVSYWMPIPC